MNDHQNPEPAERARAFGRSMGEAHAGGTSHATEGELAFPDTEAQATLHEWAGNDPAQYGMLLEAAQGGYRDGLASTPGAP